jgi:hypothetical protein
VEDAFIRRGVVQLLVNDEGLDGFGSGRSAVQGNISDRGGRRGLISQRLWNGELVERWRTDRPGIAENRLLIAVNGGKLGRIRLCSQERKRSLVAC